MEPVKESPYVFKDCCGNEIVDCFVAEREIMQNYLPALSLTPVCKSLNKPYHLALIHQILNPYICKTNMNIKLVIVKVFKFLEVIGERAVDVTEVTITKQNLKISELEALAVKCENLQSLSIENCVWRDGLDLGVFSSLKVLSKLVIENRRYNNEGTLVNWKCISDSLVHLPSLKEINFKNTSIDSTKLNTFLAGYTELAIGYLTGASYAGGLKNGLPHGEGKFISDNGNEEQIGHFIDGDFVEGILKKSNSDGSKYEGDVKNGQPNGTGKYTSLNGDEKTGHFIESTFIEGRIKRTFPNGCKYEGGFKNGRPNGEGKFTCANGDEERGHFIDGNFVLGIIKSTFADGSKYEGDVKNGQANGQGKFTYANGDEEIGEFIDGVFIKGTIKHKWL